MVWRIGDGALLCVFEGHAQILDVRYLPAEHRYVSAGADGRLVAWSPTGTDATVLFKRPVWLRAVAVLGARDHIAVADGDGAISDVVLTAAAAPDAPAHLAQPASRGGITQLRASPDGRFAVVTTSRGLVAIYDTATWAVHHGDLARGRRPARHRSQEPRRRVARNHGHLHVLSIGAPHAWRWHDVPGPVRDLIYSADGEMLGFSCIDGGTWLDDIRSDRSAYARDHGADIISVLFSPTASWFVSADRRGAVTCATSSRRSRGPRASPP